MDHVDRMQVRDLIEELQRHDPRMRVKLVVGELVSVYPGTSAAKDGGSEQHKVLILSDKRK